MKTEGTKWFKDLKAYIAECHVRRPIMDRDNLSAAEELQCQIIGGSLNSWLRKYGPPLLQERAMLCDVGGWEKDPFVVFTSEQPGLVAAREILEDDPGTIAWLNPTEFEDWNQIQPDKDYKWHVHRWSFFAPMDPETKKKAELYPLVAGESYWLHKEGTMCGPLFGRGGDHLWKWDGREPVLLQECINQWVS